MSYTVYTREKLDEAALIGCDDPSHDHGDHDCGYGPIYLHSRCHIDAPLVVHRSPSLQQEGLDEYKLICIECRKPVGVIVGERVERIHCQCKPDLLSEAFSVVWPAYTYNSGAFLLECHLCNKVIAEIKV